MRWKVAIGITVLLGLCLPTYGKPKEPKPGEAFLKVTPRSSMAPMGRPSILQVSVAIPLPTPEFFCPSVDLSIYGQPACDVFQEMEKQCSMTVRGDPLFHEFQESDCPPWREEPETVVDDSPEGGHYLPASRDIPFAWPYDGAKRVGVGPGEWTFEVKLVQGAKSRILQERATVN